MRAKSAKAKSPQGLRSVINATEKLWRQHHLTYDQAHYVAHIPPNLVVTPRASLNPLDVSRRYPHDVSSTPTAISTKGETWDTTLNRLVTTAPSPSISA